LVKKRANKSDRGVGGKPNAGLAFSVRLYLWFWFLRYAPKYDKTALKGLKGPYILIVNHPSNLDAFLLGRGVNPTTTNYVASQYFFRFPILKFLLSRVGAIPKAHSTKDIQSLRLMLKSLAAGRILVVFPEGRRSMDGRGSRFSEAMAKLAKKSGLPVVSAMMTGSYLVWPRWADHPAVGPLSVSFRRVLEPADLKVLTVQEIHSRMMDALRFDEYAANRRDGRKYRTKDRTGHIDRLLHACPDCGACEAIRGHGDNLACSCCGASAVMDQTGFIRRLTGKGTAWPQVPEWFSLQRAILVTSMADPAFRIQAGVNALGRATNPNRPMVPVGSGQASLGREGLVFTGQVDGKQETLLFPISLMDVLPVSLGKHFEICDENGVYWQFALDGDAKAVLFEQYADICLYGEGSSWV